MDMHRRISIDMHKYDTILLLARVVMRVSACSCSKAFAHLSVFISPGFEAGGVPPLLRIVLAGCIAGAFDPERRNHLDMVG